MSRPPFVLFVGAVAVGIIVGQWHHSGLDEGATPWLLAGLAFAWGLFVRRFSR